MPPDHEKAFRLQRSRIGNEAIDFRRKVDVERSEARVRREAVSVRWNRDVPERTVASRILG
ncbi:MAG: hypothetical protein JO036_14945 [Candidatus Eremiobacteraeota bacterium]|nr:hypothetical protein [Candidatus Eremiobacteraeota bacterium]